MKLAYSNGEIEVNVGDRFQWSGAEFEIAGFTGGRIYSPCGLGGTPILNARVIAGECRTGYPVPDKVHGVGDVIEFCGDSVAAFIAESRLPHGSVEPR